MVKPVTLSTERALGQHQRKQPQHDAKSDHQCNAVDRVEEPQFQQPELTSTVRTFGAEQGRRFRTVRTDHYILQ
jgi:hypothetical protein